MGLDVMIIFLSWVASVVEYYPFGWEMPGRGGSSEAYRYGFNGKEKDDDGEFGSQTNLDFGARIYNPAIGRWLSVDPGEAAYPSLSPYSYVANNPLVYIDPTGAYIEPADDKARKLYYNIYKNATDDQRAVLDRLNDSDIVYRIKSSGGDKGYNGITKGGCDQDCGEQFVVDIFFDGKQDSDTQINALGDELEHARQFEDGELALVELNDGSGVGGNSYDLIDERKSKDAGLATLENVKDVKANANGTNPQKYKNAKNNGAENSYILSFPGYAPLGKRKKSIPATADANTYKAPSVKKVAYRVNGKTEVKTKE